MAETSNETTNLEILKQKAIEETIEEATKGKNILFAEIQKKILNRYFTKDGNSREELEDRFLEGVSMTITDDIKKFKEDLNNVSNEVELNNIKTSVINSINNSQTKSYRATAATSTTAVASTYTQRNRRRSSKTQEYTTTSTEHYELDNFNINISQQHKELYDQLKGKEKPDLEPFACAMKCYEEQKGALQNSKYLTVVDFSKPNTENRFYVINMDTKSVEYATTVGHGQGSGRGKWATSFSNISGSNQSSLGFFTISSTYENNTKRTRTGLRMHGTNKDKKNNGNAASRGIFMHPGTNVSQGCFTLPKNKAKEIMSKVEGGALFAYAKSKDYFAQSDYFNTSSTGDVLAA